MARVLGVMARSMRSGSMFRSSFFTSTKTGVAPTRAIGARRRKKSVGGGDHLVARFYPERHERENEGIRAARAGNGVGHPGKAAMPSSSSAQ